MESALKHNARVSLATSVLNCIGHWCNGYYLLYLHNCVSKWPLPWLIHGLNRLTTTLFIICKYIYIIDNTCNK